MYQYSIEHSIESKKKYRSIDRQYLRSAIMEYRTKKNLVAVTATLLDISLYCLTVVGIVYCRFLGLKAVLCGVAAVMIARLFTLGHDACHGSLTSNKRLNSMLGRITFLGSMTPFSLWHLGHNLAHHGFTNLKGRDHVWVPLSIEEYRALSRCRRALERVYRSPLGLGMYYLIELWWKKLYFPNKRHVGAWRRSHFWDSTLVSVFAALQVSAIIYLANRTQQDVKVLLFFAVICPFMLWNMIMGFVIFQHHTHVNVAWFNKKEEWQSFCTQVRCSMRIIFPFPFGALLHNIMEHTAHHLDYTIPSYQLRGAQAILEENLKDEILIQPWSIQYFLDCVRKCKLYDYDRHRWLDFDGNVTAKVLSSDQV